MEDIKIAFAQIPEGYYRMQVRIAYQKRFHTNIDHLNIATIIEQINDTYGDIDLKNQGITSTELVGIHDLLIARNEVRPVRTLNLASNQITLLPRNFGQGWAQLHGLWLYGNQLTELPQNFGYWWPLS